eukprot:TRINITY_DN13181_c0_g3_i3.p1 TRINITY_DN13181_c0_g3~~TRINITY_DN13181_c0_g3_i3.p1  ORF type:complete len:489 (+),score=118.87 TRINITY_DN13181_c0_g3_i3:90-1469(+)
MTSSSSGSRSTNELTNSSRTRCSVARNTLLQNNGATGYGNCTAITATAAAPTTNSNTTCNNNNKSNSNNSSNSNSTNQARCVMPETLGAKSLKAHAKHITEQRQRQRNETKRQEQQQQQQQQQHRQQQQQQHHQHQQQHRQQAVFSLRDGVARPEPSATNDQQQQQQLQQRECDEFTLQNHEHLDQQQQQQQQQQQFDHNDQCHMFMSGIHNGERWEAEQAIQDTSIHRRNWMDCLSGSEKVQILQEELVQEEEHQQQQQNYQHQQQQQQHQFQQQQNYQLQVEQLNYYHQQQQQQQQQQNRHLYSTSDSSYTRSNSNSNSQASLGIAIDGDDAERFFTHESSRQAPLPQLTRESCEALFPRRSSSSASGTADHSAGAPTELSLRLQALASFTTSVELPDPCAICLSHMCVPQRLGRLPCGHCFHRVCVVTWLRSSPNCPHCRCSVTSQAALIQEFTSW